MTGTLCLTLWVQQLGQTHLLLGHVESVLQIVVSVGPLQVVKLNQVRPAEAGEQLRFKWEQGTEENRVEVSGNYIQDTYHNSFVW